MFVSFWSVISLLFDGLIGYAIVNQIRSLSFSETRGVILESEVETIKDSDGDTYRPEIEYEYFVDNARYVSDCIRNGEFSSNDSYARTFVDSHPVGAKVPVYFSRQNPDDAVIVRGVQGRDLFITLFLTPFNLIMLTGWFVGWRWWRKKPIESPGFPVADDGQHVRLKLHYLPPICVGAVTLGGLSFFSIFIVGFLLGGFNPSLSTISVVWVLVFGSSVIASIWAYFRNESGSRDLVLNRFRDTVELPVFMERERPTTMPLAEIIRASFAQRTSKTSEGDSVPEYEVFLECKNQSEKIAKLSDEESAKRLCEWLNNEWFPKSRSGARG